MGHDYSDHQESIDPDRLEQLGELAKRLASVEADVEAKEAELKELGERYRDLREKLIPDLMLEIGMKAFTTVNGLKIELREEVRASLPKDNDKREAAFAWLDEHGHAGLVKDTFTIKFGRDQADRAELFMEYLKAFDSPINQERKKDINHQTLLAFLREQLREGESVPLEMFGSFVQKFAKVTS